MAWRGPFACAELYADISLRRATDIDLLVPSDHSEAARMVAAENGWRLVTSGFSAGYFRRHHLHWPLAHRDTGLLCDLHWRLDHPFSRHQVDYQGLFARSREYAFESFTWRHPSPPDLFLVHCIHLAKETRQRLALPLQPGGDEMLHRHGDLRHWRDLAAIVQKYRAQLDWDAILQTARAWRITPVVHCVLAGLSTLFQVEDLPETACRLAPPSRRRISAQTIPGLRRLAARGVFRPDQIGDVWHCLWPERTWFDADTPLQCLFQRTGHCLQTMFRLAFMAGDMAMQTVFSPFQQPFPATGESDYEH
jgi:hypothetical protein